MQSSVPYFKAALLARLLADSVLATGTTKVAWGNPHPNDWPREVVIIGATSNRVRYFVAGLSQAREEYDIELMVNCTGPAENSNQHNQERAYALMDAVEDSIRAWDIAGDTLCTGAWGSVGNALCSEAAHDVEGLDMEDRDASVIVTCHVTARI